MHSQRMILECLTVLFGSVLAAFGTIDACRALALLVIPYCAISERVSYGDSRRLAHIALVARSSGHGVLRGCCNCRI